MDGNSSLQPTQETVPGTRKCKYQLVLFLICLLFALDFIGDQKSHNWLCARGAGRERGISYIPNTEKLN